MKIERCPACYSTNLGRAEPRGGLVYSVCKDCGHCEVISQYDLDVAFKHAQDSYFGDNHQLESIDLSPFEVEILQQRYSVISSYLRNKGKVLEVGPGAGNIVRWLVSNGHAVTAVEHSSAVSRLLSTCEKNVAILTGEFEKICLPPKSFDAFCSFHVIEHVPDPLEHLIKAYEVTRPGGLAFIATPNAKSWQQIVFQSLSPNFDAAHLHLFSPSSLRTFCEKAGWAIVLEDTPEYTSSWLRVGSKALRRMRKEDEERTAGKYAQSTSSRFLTLFACVSGISLPIRRLQSKLGYGNELFFVLRK